MENKHNKILFIGSACPLGMYAELQKQGAISDYAAYTFQEALISGLSENGCELEVLTAPSIKSYPRCSMLMHKGFSIQDNDGVKWHGVGFINIPVVRLVCNFITESIALYKMHDDDRDIIIYSLPSFQLLASTLFARKNKKYVIITDLPEFMSGSRNPIYRILKKIDRWIISSALRYINGCVLLSRSMLERLTINDKPYIVVEGIYTVSSTHIKGVKYPKTVLYTGAIEERYGLRDLLEAFTRIDGPEYRLWLCGGGDIQMVKEYTNKDSRIVYYGSLPHEKVLQMQREVALLVNPRHSNEEFTKYSFPSKTMEYMASGTPTLMCRLASIPAEYYEHLFFFDDESILGMSSRIKELLDAPYGEVNKIGTAASEFIKAQKNSKIQTGRILNMILDNR